MPARQKVPTEVLVRALIEWKGNVQATAEQLGMHPKNLRERAARLGLDLDAIRRGTYQPERGGTVRTGTVPGEAHGPISVSDPFSRRGPAPTLRAVQQLTADKADSPAGLPIRTVAARRKASRLSPPNEERLADFQRQIEALCSCETDGTTLLNQFFEEAFPSWAEEKLALAPGPAPRRGRPGRRGGPE